MYTKGNKEPGSQKGEDFEGQISLGDERFISQYPQLSEIEGGEFIRLNKAERFK